MEAVRLRDLRGFFPPDQQLHESDDARQNRTTVVSSSAARLTCRPRLSAEMGRETRASVRSDCDLTPAGHSASAELAGAVLAPSSRVSR
jgi:hypothetical protein